MTFVRVYKKFNYIDNNKRKHDFLENILAILPNSLKINLIDIHLYKIHLR